MRSFNLQQIIHGDHGQLDELFATIAHADNVTPLQTRHVHAEQLFIRLLGDGHLDAQISALLNKLKPLFVAQCLGSDAFYSDAQHHARHFFSCILEDSSHWYPRAGKTNHVYFTKLAQLVDLAQQTWGGDPLQTAHFHAALSAFAQWQEREKKRAATLEARLCTNEQQQQKLQRAERRVIDLINTALADRPMPNELHNAICTALKNELQQCLANSRAANEQDEPLWQLWLQLLPALGNIFSSNGIHVDNQYLYKNIPVLIAELEQSTTLHQNHSPAYAQLVNNIHQHLLRAVQKRSDECSLFPALPAAAERTDNIRITPALLQPGDDVQKGDWLIFRGAQDENIRCKVAFKNAANGQLLLVDRNGHKVMSKSAKDFALCLATGIARPLHAYSAINAITEQLQPLIERATHWQVTEVEENTAQMIDALEQQQQQANTQAAHQKRQEEQQKLALQLDARRMASRKAMAEARALAEAKIQRDVQQKLEHYKLPEENMHVPAAAIGRAYEQAEQLLDELHIGAWLELSLDEKIVRCKLSVIIGASGKYIFVDQLGWKLAEYQRGQLVQILAEERGRVIHKGYYADDPLVRVIRSLRRSVS